MLRPSLARDHRRSARTCFGGAGFQGVTDPEYAPADFATFERREVPLSALPSGKTGAVLKLDPRPVCPGLAVSWIWAPETDSWGVSITHLPSGLRLGPELPPTLANVERLRKAARAHARGLDWTGSPAELAANPANVAARLAIFADLKGVDPWHRTSRGPAKIGSYSIGVRYVRGGTIIAKHQLGWLRFTPRSDGLETHWVTAYRSLSSAKAGCLRA